MSNKTVLQELQDKISNLEKLSNNISPDYPNDVRYLTGYKDALNSVRKIIDESNILEKEKQQIMDSWLNERDMTWINSRGEDATIEDLKPNAEDYYNEKYGNNGTTNKEDR
ncbi:hypothetical protein KRE40_03715 [Elizabethkingia meningoseptica]|uniref:hypothetical protein n=1 Tax=Elizabethkingia meningoseptica TaxID=238 RepID=UPI0023B01126|nr:hypothetical protein [Elizabethkingia meningoseptica]MDE5507758.1 hypothetical protein [Elizabethkingia meningoseptica]MDE5516397.1 hypothetical protein [Elizabethkingia meningoseptica]MDN4033745.1 hypothetical protein [Elizabethkingia meningoseptica]